MRNAFVLEAEGPARLSPRGNLESELITQQRYFYLITKSSLSKVNWQLIENVIALSLKEFVFTHRDCNIEIPRWSSFISGFALSPQTYLRAAIHPRGYLDPDAAGSVFLASSPTLRAGLSNNLSLTMTSTAGGPVDEAPEEAPLNTPHLPTPITIGAQEWLAARLTASATAARADFHSVNIYLFITSCSYLFKRDGEITM
jgi:hypothetical protein